MSLKNAERNKRTAQAAPIEISPTQ